MVLTFIPLYFQRDGSLHPGVGGLGRGYGAYRGYRVSRGYTPSSVTLTPVPPLDTLPYPQAPPLPPGRGTLLYLMKYNPREPLGCGGAIGARRGGWPAPGAQVPSLWSLSASWYHSLNALYPSHTLPGPPPPPTL